MRAAVDTDTTTRTIQITVEGVPDLDLTTYHQKPRVIRPDRLTIQIVNGQVRFANISGGLVLKSGQPSTQVRDNKRFYGARELAEVPPWVRTLVNEAPQDVTSWYYPDSENPEEVLPL